MPLDRERFFDGLKSDLKRCLRREAVVERLDHRVDRSFPPDLFGQFLRPEMVDELLGVLSKASNVPVEKLKESIAEKLGFEPWAMTGDEPEPPPTHDLAT